jgi:hypothetical protein
MTQHRIVSKVLSLTMHVGPTPSGPEPSGNPAQNAGLYGWRQSKQHFPNVALVGAGLRAGRLFMPEARALFNYSPKLSGSRTVRCSSPRLRRYY